MKTGYLAKEQFKDWKADEVKALAKELGASCDGKKEEIIDRICQIEVGVPDEAELTPEEVKAIREAEAEEEAKKEAEEASAKAEGTVQVKCIERFEDLQVQQIREVGEVWDVTPGRADTLEKKRLVEKA
jgi:hypothetical protein